MTLSLEQLAARAASPATSQADLYQLVSNYPQLRPVVAANPNAYPQLLEWLANLNDPQINAGLARSPLPLARQLLAKHNPQFLAQLEGQKEQAASAASTASAQDVAPTQVAAGPLVNDHAPTRRSVLSSNQETSAPSVADSVFAMNDKEQPAPGGVEGHAQNIVAANPSVIPLDQPLGAQVPDPATTGSATMVMSTPVYAPDPTYAEPTYDYATANEAPEQEADSSAKKGGLPLFGWISLAVLILAVAVGAYMLGRDTSPHSVNDAGPITPTVVQTETAAPVETETPTPSATPTATVKAPAPDGAREMTSFTSPSGNITCTLGDDQVSCTIKEYSFNANGPSCSNNSTPFTATVTTQTSAGGSCQTAFKASGTTLAYNSSAKHGVFACTSTEEGVTCWNTLNGQGFTVNRHAANSEQR